MTGREQFETIYMKREPEASMAFNESVGRYKYAFIQSQYEFFLEAWQASREALEVELPQRQSLCASGYGNGYFVACNDGEGLEYDDVVEAIRAAGIKVKGE